MCVYIQLVFYQWTKMAIGEIDGYGTWMDGRREVQESRIYIFRAKDIDLRQLLAINILQYMYSGMQFRSLSAFNYKSRSRLDRCHCSFYPLN